MAGQAKVIWTMWPRKKRMEFLNDMYGTGRDATYAHLWKGYQYNNSHWATKPWNKLPNYIREDLKDEYDEDW